MALLFALLLTVIILTMRVISRKRPGLPVAAEAPQLSNSRLIIYLVYWHSNVKKDRVPFGRGIISANQFVQI
jgi:hypothetical protein